MSHGDHDRVVMASRKPDGTPDQTPDFEYIGDKDTSIKATEKQLTEQRVSAADVEARGVTASGEGEFVEDPSIAKVAKAHEAAAKDAAKDAKAEVNARFASDESLKGKSNPASSRETTTSSDAASRETTEG